MLCPSIGGCSGLLYLGYRCRMKRYLSWTLSAYLYLGYSSSNRLGWASLNYKVLLTVISLKTKKAPDFSEASSDPAGIRTQDPYIKSVLLYQLSYGIIIFYSTCIRTQNPPDQKLGCSTN